MKNEERVDRVERAGQTSRDGSDLGAAQTNACSIYLVMEVL